jgi:hypothetical protein
VPIGVWRQRRSSVSDAEIDVQDLGDLARFRHERMRDVPPGDDGDDPEP